MYPNLRAEMARKRVRNNDLAELLGLSPARISEKLNGNAKNGFSLDEAEKIRDFLGVVMPLEELFEREAV